ncbi:head-tail joining protein [Rickettsia endosymbiont of Orchestes rusci]|uniref:head-tail joining protein n=1 Tax=Rickettsia endosymbiont of Orchestes rusci TaxID=3066250 RepID=UPI00313D7E98
MAFQEDFSEFLDVEQGFAVKAILTPAFGEPYVIKGIMAEEYFDIDSGIAGVAGNKPVFECTEDEITEVEYGDLLTMRNRNYRIVAIKPDGSGWASLLLERQN